MATVNADDPFGGRTGSARFIDPVVLARIGRLEVLARTVVDGFISGLHRSAHPGVSMDFAEHRAYMPGDDVRRIDWRVYARTDRLYVKEYEADTNTNMSVLLDVSRSMDYGDPLSKLDYARFLAASLCYLANKQRDRVGLVTFDDALIDVIPPSAKHFETALHVLDKLKSGGTTDYAAALRSYTQGLTRRSVLAIISDFYAPPDRVISAMSELSAKGNDVVLFQVLDNQEVNFSFDEATNFEDLETGEKTAVAPQQFRTQYLKRIREHASAIERAANAQRMDYALFDTSMPLDHALFKYLSWRQRMLRTRR